MSIYFILENAQHKEVKNFPNIIQPRIMIFDEIKVSSKDFYKSCSFANLCIYRWFRCSFVFMGSSRI